MKRREHSPKSSRRGVRAIVVLGLSILLAGGAALTLGASSTSSSVSKPPGAPPIDRLSSAKIAFADRQYEQAEALLRELLSGSAADSAVKALLGRVLLARGRLLQAREIFESLEKANPKDREAARGLGAIYRAMGEHERAVTTLTLATDLDPQNPEVWKERGQAEREKGDFFAALSSIQQSLSLDPKQVDLSSLLTELAMGKADPTEGASGFPRPFQPPSQARPIDFQSAGPRPLPPDPSQHFPKPGGRPK